MQVIADNRDGTPNDNVIVIPSHISGLPFLENLLKSFGSYDRYPILIVINEYRDEAEPHYQEILAKFRHLPLTVGRLKSNSFEFGALLFAYDETPYENFFLLPHSCEIVDPAVFEIAFEEYRHRSVAYFLRRLSDYAIMWESHIGKYRREILTAMEFKKFQPHNIFEATFLSEWGFTSLYYMHDPTAHAFYRSNGPTGEITEKFGKLRLRMATPYLIKWKSHWTPSMLFKSFPRDQRRQLLICRLRFWIWYCRGHLIEARRGAWEALREGFIGLRGGALWSPNYYHWRKQLKAHPELRNGDFRLCCIMLRRLGYKDAFVRFLIDGGNCLHDHALDSNSLVLDIGAFDGEYAEKLVNKYRCEIHCFEPMPHHFGHLAQRFVGQSRVHLHKVGLSFRNYETTMSVKGLGSSEFGFALTKLPVQMKDVAEVFATLDRDVDLLKINIEGGEYPLLKRMLEADLLRRCKKIMVQFHDRPISPKLARRLRRELIAGIEETHNPTFSYPFVWEGWERKLFVSEAGEIPLIAQFPSQHVAAH